MPTRIALVEDHPQVRQRFLDRLHYVPDLDLVLVAETGYACMQQLAELDAHARPSVILMDIEMPGQDGIETTRQVKDRYPNIDVVMLTVFAHDEAIFEAIKAGASGYLLKDSSMTQIREAVQTLEAGGAPISPAIAQRVLTFVQTQLAPNTRATEALNLSHRELEVLRYLVGDGTEAEIGAALCISPHTVRTHAKNIYRKLHVNSRAGAVRKALSDRLV